jgi:general stress protein 26
MEEEEIKQECMKLMETADTVCVSTIDGEGYPQIRAMVNLRNKEQFSNLAGLFEGHDEDLLIYMTTDTASDKFKQIEANPKVSVYFCNPKNIQGLLLTGEIEVVADMDIKKQLWQDDWTMYYPGGVDGPEYNILCLKPRYVKFWSVPMPKPIRFELSR